MGEADRFIYIAVGEYVAGDVYKNNRDECNKTILPMYIDRSINDLQIDLETLQYLVLDNYHPSRLTSKIV